MEASDPTPKPAADPKPKPARGRKARPSDRPRGKRSLNLSLPDGDYERLALHALDAHTTMSEVVSRLVNEHLTGLSLHRSSAVASRAG